MHVAAPVGVLDEVAKGKKKGTNLPSNRKVEEQESGPKSRGGRWQPSYARTKVDKPDPVDWKFFSAAGLAVMLIAFSTHIFTINDGLVLNDRANLDYIFNQGKIGATAEDSLSNMFSRPLMQPWTKHSFISDRTDYKGETKWYHGINILFHCAATAYLFMFVFRMIKNFVWQKRTTISPYYAAMASAAIFATHPFATQAVANLSARGALLGTTNFLLCLNFLLVGLLTKNQIIGGLGYGLALYAGAMAIWSAPEMVSLPAVALVVALLAKNPMAEWKKSFQESPFALGVMSILAVATPFLAIRGFDPVATLNIGMPILEKTQYVASQIKAIPLYYLRCFALPFGLSIDPPMAVASGFSDPFVWVGAALIAACGYVAIRSKSIAAGLACLFLLAGFVPHAVFIQPDTVADWVAYLPLAGVAIFTGSFIANRAAKNSRNATVLLVSLLVLFADLSILRDWQWSSNLNLWTSALEVRPKSALAHAMLAIEYAKRQELEKADKLSATAIQLSPQLCLAHYSRGKVLLDMQKYSEAEEQLKLAENLAEAQKLSEKLKKDIQFGLVEAYLFQNRFELAQPLLLKLITKNPADGPDARAYRLAGLAAYKSGQFKPAWEKLGEAANMDSEMATCFAPMAEIALLVGRGDLAYTVASSYQEKLDSDAARLLLARAAIINNKAQMGVKLLQELLTKNPKNAAAALVLSKYHKAAGNETEATKWREEAIKAVPDIETKLSLPEFGRPIPGVTPEPPKEKETPSSNNTTTTTTSTSTTTDSKPDSTEPTKVPVEPGTSKPVPSSSSTQTAPPATSSGTETTTGITTSATSTSTAADTTTAKKPEQTGEPQKPADHGNSGAQKDQQK